MTSAPMQVGDLNLESLPTQPMSLDMFILRDQNIVLTVNWVTTDQVVTMDIPSFVQALNDRFAQTLDPVQKPYNQALVLVDQVFKFIDMNSPNTFVAYPSSDLKRVYLTLTKIIEQESTFLNQLISFKSMLESAQVLTDVTTKLKRRTIPRTALMMPDQ